MEVIAIHKDWSESSIAVDETTKQETIDLVKKWYEQGWIMGWELRGTQWG